MNKTALAKLKTEIRRNLKLGIGPCDSMRAAIKTLGLPFGVQGDDVEIARGEDHFEMWDHSGPGVTVRGPSGDNAPVLSVNLVNGKWKV